MRLSRCSAVPLSHGSQAGIRARLSCRGHPGEAAPHRPALVTKGHLCLPAHRHGRAPWPRWQVSPAQYPRLINSPCLYTCTWRRCCGLSQDPRDPVRAGGTTKPLATTHIKLNAPSPSMGAVAPKVGASKRGWEEGLWGRCGVPLNESLQGTRAPEAEGEHRRL